jgi:hypothetical protein
MSRVSLLRQRHNDRIKTDKNGLDARSKDKVPSFFRLGKRMQDKYRKLTDEPPHSGTDEGPVTILSSRAPDRHMLVDTGSSPRFTATYPQQDCGVLTLRENKSVFHHKYLTG